MELSGSRGPRSLWLMFRGRASRTCSGASGDGANSGEGGAVPSSTPCNDNTLGSGEALAGLSCFGLLRAWSRVRSSSGYEPDSAMA